MNYFVNHFRKYLFSHPHIVTYIAKFLTDIASHNEYGDPYEEESP